MTAEMTERESERGHGMFKLHLNPFSLCNMLQCDHFFRLKLRSGAPTEGFHGLFAQRWIKTEL